MRVFVTGATGFIGMALVEELLEHGHDVLGMARTDDGAARLAAAGAGVHRGDLADLGSLQRGAAQADGVSPGAARIGSEVATLALASQGVRSSVVRIPPMVHGDGDKAMIPRLIATARKKGVAAYEGQGTNRWPAAHRHDVARLFRLALEDGSAGSRYHAVAEEGVSMLSIARTRMPPGTRLPRGAPALPGPSGRRAAAL